MSWPPCFQSDLWLSGFHSGLTGFPATLHADALRFTLPARSQNFCWPGSNLTLIGVTLAFSHFNKAVLNRLISHDSVMGFLVCGLKAT